MADVDVVMITEEGNVKVDLTEVSPVAEDATTEVIQEEVEAPIQEEEVPELSETEQKAVELGWRPQTDFEEEGKNFVSAEEFVNRQPLFDKIDDLKKTHKSEIVELRNVINGLSESMQKAERQGYEKALTALQEERLEAVETGDVNAFVEAESKINEMSQQIQSDPQPEPEGEDPEILRFAQSHKEWFNFDNVDNASMTTDADAFYQKLVEHRADLPVTEALGMTEEYIKSKYPKRFQNEARARVSAVEGKRSHRSGKTGEAGLQDLSDFQKSIYMDIKKENPTYTVAEYLGVAKRSIAII